MGSSLLALWLAGVASAAEGERMVDRIAAIVGPDVITLAELYSLGGQHIAATCPKIDDVACRTEAEAQVLDAQIRRVLIRQELQQLNADVTSARIDEAIATVVAEYGLPDRESLRQEVELTGSTWEAYRDEIADSIRRQDFQHYLLAPRITISEEELIDFYQRTVKQIDAPPVVRLAAFGYKVPPDLPAVELGALVTEISEAINAVRRGERTWPELTERYDTAKLARVFEGATFRPEELRPNLAAAIAATPVGEPAAPVLIDGLIWGVFVLTREKGAVEAPPLDAVRARIEDQLYEEKMIQAEEEWYAQARRRTAIRERLTTP